MNRVNRQQGFSLIEVAIALLVVAVSLGGVIYAVGNIARNETVLAEKMFARWVAENQIADARLKKLWPSVGSTNGDAKMAGRSWRWEQKALNTPDENVRKIEVSVWSPAGDGDSPVVTVTGFLIK